MRPMTSPALPAKLADRPARQVGRVVPIGSRGSRIARHDPRWPAIAATLAALREKRRFSVRIVDADCGAGALLLYAAHHARLLGFTAIEARGIDGAPSLIGLARAAARRVADPAIGISFEVGEVIAALHDEDDAPADLVLWHAPHAAAIDAALARAGTVVVCDAQDGQGGERAA